MEVIVAEVYVVNVV